MAAVVVVAVAAVAVPAVAGGTAASKRRAEGLDESFSIGIIYCGRHRLDGTVQAAEEGGVARRSEQASACAG